MSDVIYTRTGFNRRQSLKQRILNKLSSQGIFVMDDAALEIGKLSRKAMHRIKNESKLYGTRMRRGSKLNWATKQSSSKNPRHTRYEAEISIVNFIKALRLDSVNNVVTAETVHLSLNRLCPMWPFC